MGVLPGTTYSGSQSQSQGVRAVHKLGGAGIREDWTYGRKRSHTGGVLEGFHDACHCCNVPIVLDVLSNGNTIKIL